MEKGRKEEREGKREQRSKGRKKEEAELSSSWQSCLVDREYSLDMFLYLIASLFGPESLIMTNLLNQKTVKIRHKPIINYATM